MEPRSLMLVDDEDDIREIAGLALSSLAGWKVVSVASGREALKALEQQEVDLVLLDVMMPDMDGPTFLRQMRERAAWAQIPVIYITAKRPRDDGDHATLGVRGVIRKPFDPMRLHEEVRQILTRPPDGAGSQVGGRAEG